MGILTMICWLLVSMLVLYIAVILLITRGLIRLQRGTSRPAAMLPKVSVLLAVRNESGTLRDCLNSLLQQDYPRELMEVIVSDDFSEDDSVGIARRWAAGNPGFRLKVITANEEHSTATGKKSALARAVGVATGEMILCTDADTERGPHWVSAMMQQGGRPDGVRNMTLGPVAFHHENNLLEKIQSLEFMGLIGVTAGAAGVGFPVMCNGANIAYRRAAYREAGGFDNNMQFASGDDQFLMAGICKKFGRDSVRFALNREAVVYTAAQDTLRGFFSQRLRWVSKSRGYREPAVIGLALLTYFVHLFLLLGMAAGLYFPSLLALSLALWLAKILLEYPLVWLMADFLGKKHLLGYYFISQVFQLFYVVVIGMIGNLIPYQWKGRRLK